MIKAIVDGQQHPDSLADHAKGTLRGKRPELRLALRGRITNYHRLMSGELMEDLEFVEGKLKWIEKEIATKVDIDTLPRLATVPGIDLNYYLDSAGRTWLRHERLP
jgi:transposase